MPAQKNQITHRSAITGQYVSENYAKKHPKTTVTETSKITPIKKPGTKKK
jgi:hypothetical protein